MLYYFPYVKDITKPDRFIRLGWFLEEAKAEHTVRMYMSKQRKLTTMTKFNTQPDKITFYINGGTLVGYIKKETVKLCQDQTTELINLSKQIWEMQRYFATVTWSAIIWKGHSHRLNY